ncbi:MAG: VWA domain-containing protein [Candidatus Bathyarchaeota archaeon]|nr:VWA domain-containing protein [Candidatus Bathyarchaeota archaeon]
MTPRVFLDESRPIYPFTAIVGQDELKMALILNTIDPNIGGALLTGPKGTGKSSLVRAVEEIFPVIEVVEDCVFKCNPFDPTSMCDDCQSRFDAKKVLPKIQKKVRVVTLPLSATEDRVVGSLDVEVALRKGIKALQPGILAEANQNSLYIDEVNLLPDHLVDLILDVSASGWNVIEREGISITHPSRFVLVGTMNPEEGGLRPQILDRFGLHAQAQRLVNPQDRMKVIRRREAFLRNPLAFCETYESQQEDLKRRIEVARDVLPRVQTPQSVMESIAKICTHLQVDGYRPDIVMMRAAKALAAFNNRELILPEDLLMASNLALSHRTRNSGQIPPPTTKEIKKAFKITPVGENPLLAKLGRLRNVRSPFSFGKFRRIPLLAILVVLVFILALFFTPFFSAQLFLQFFVQIFSSIDRVFMLFLIMTLLFVIFSLIMKRPEKTAPSQVLDLAKITSEQMSSRRAGRQGTQVPQDGVRSPSLAETVEERETEVEEGEKVFESIPQEKQTEFLKRTKRSQEERSLRGRRYLVGKRAPVVTSLSRGRYVWHALPKEKPWNIALEPTIRAAAPYQLARKKQNLSVVIKPQDIRIKMREYRAPFTILILVDLSLSMISSIVNLGKAITTLHQNAFRRRDRVGLVVFKGNDAFVLQEPTTNVELVVKKLWRARVSDFTPMAKGMLKACRVLRLEKQRNKDSVHMLIIISDGIANVPLKQPLSKRGRKTFLSEPQADAIDVARLLARDNVKNIVINTSHRPLEAMMMTKGGYRRRTLLNPTAFLMQIAESSKGSYYGLVLNKEDAVRINPDIKRKHFTIGSVLTK